MVRYPRNLGNDEATRCLYSPPAPWDEAGTSKDRPAPFPPVPTVSRPAYHDASSSGNTPTAGAVIIACVHRSPLVLESHPNRHHRVMGATGCGKSTVCAVCLAIMNRISSNFLQFINLASSSSLRVGMGLESCTAGVGLADKFTLDGRSVILIDTPGFNDTTKSDSDILEMIAAFLATT